MKSRHAIFTALGALLLAAPGRAQDAAPVKDQPAPAAEKAASHAATTTSAPTTTTSAAAASSTTTAASAEAPNAPADDNGWGITPPTPAAEEPATTPSATMAPSAEAKPSAKPEAPTETKKPGINPDAVPALRGTLRPTQRSMIGLDPGAPQAPTVAGGVTPAFGQPSQSGADWVFDIHGYLLLPLRVGIGERETPRAGQKKTVLHTPPVVPGAFETFEYTGINPDPWAQLNFEYGNRDVTATVVLAARTVSNANAYFNPSDQLGINDAFITFHPKPEGGAKYNVHVGAFANRYGVMGEYDLGRYGTPLIAQISGTGVTGNGTFDLGSLQLSAELGLMGQLNKAPVGVEPAGWNGFTDPNAGTSFAVHSHLGLGFSRNVTLGTHVVHVYSQDDRANTGAQKDGKVSVFGGDLRLTLQRFGHLYFGYGFTDAQTARSVSGVLRVLNAQGGLGLMEEYFGLQSEGTGQLHTFGGQYDLSLGNLARSPGKYEGQGPDLVLGAFGLATQVKTPVPEFDGITKAKYGGEATYSMLSWLATGVRYDRVQPNTDDDTQTHSVVSPRLIFKSDWGSRDQVVLQYSRYFYGSNTAVMTGYPPHKDVTVVPDEDVVSLTASAWW